MLCLDIPVPRCVQGLVHEPPVCFSSEPDIQAVKLIRNFGKEFGRLRDEIDQACSLASGQSDLVILLERPHISQTYHGPLASLFSSKGARSIHTVTVLGAFSFKPQDSTPIPSERCHQLIEEILKLKKPKVVLCCWNQSCQQPFVAQFKSYGVGKWPFRHEVDIQGSTTIAIRPFHPAAAVCYDESRKVCCRILLICHFALAFAELAGSTTVPGWMETVCKDSSAEFINCNDSGALSHLKETAVMLIVLQKMVGTQKGPRRYPQSEGRLAEHQRQQVNTLLRQLFASGFNKGAENIARLCLLLREYKYYRPSTRQDILSRLDELGSQQNLLQVVGDVITSSPSRLSYVIGFSDDNDDFDLEK
ncbi:hypothetical protein NCS52_01521800 [Fusarium sp. LHS14.1]|nr:hypothetical protein NCS52_01521800 [Fusarium sp. LHS14.1]